MTVASGFAGTSEDIAAGLPTLSVVIPTRNESGNIAELLARLSAVSIGTGIELIFVDDSDDNTTATIERGRRGCPHDIVVHHRQVGGRRPVASGSR